MLPARSPEESWSWRKSWYRTDSGTTELLLNPRGAVRIFIHTSLQSSLCPRQRSPQGCRTLQLTQSGNSPISLQLVGSHGAMQEQAVTLWSVGLLQEDFQSTEPAGIPHMSWGLKQKSLQWAVIHGRKLNLPTYTEAVKCVTPEACSCQMLPFWADPAEMHVHNLAHLFNRWNYFDARLQVLSTKQRKTV